MTAIRRIWKITNSIKLDEGLARILCQVQDITFHLSTFYHGKSQIHPLDLREAITSSQYSLLSFKHHRSSITREGLIHEMMRLILLIYFGTLLNESPPGVSIYDMAGARLKSTLIEIRSHDSLNLDFSLWIMFLAASMVRNPDTKSYFVASINQIVEELGVSDWSSVETLLQSFFWVAEIHGKTFRSIWNAV